MDDDRTILVTLPPVHIHVQRGASPRRDYVFRQPFRLGRSHDCDVQVIERPVSKVHAEVVFEQNRWWIRDLRSANGTFLDGQRVETAPLPASGLIELGQGGPMLQVTVGDRAPERVQVTPPSRPTPETVPPAGREQPASVTQIISRYLSPSDGGSGGEHTQMIRLAFDRVTRQYSKKYKAIIGVVALLLIAAATIAVWQHFKLQSLRSTAVDIFYSMKEMELQIAQLEEMVVRDTDPQLLPEILAKRQRIRELQQRYEKFVEELGLYDNLDAEERLIFQVARQFGECDAVIPKGFVKKVKQYIHKWKTTARLSDGIRRARRNGYTATVVEAMQEHNLPPHFFYLGLQESGFDARAVGPKTRYGYAKGIWQFITPTARDYGLKPGPLYHLPRYDPQDERFHFQKATRAAARYLKHIYTTEAQASGLLVIASYNWGQGNVLGLIRQMPENPKERNFWELLKRFRIPRETYDYVFYIFSAAVIGENPDLFGFSFETPLADLTAAVR